MPRARVAAGRHCRTRPITTLQPLISRPLASDSRLRYCQSPRCSSRVGGFSRIAASGTESVNITLLVSGQVKARLVGGIQLSPCR